MDRNQRWTGCQHGKALTGIIQYQRNLDRIQWFNDDEFAERAFRAGHWTRGRVDEACIAEQAKVQASRIVYEDDSGFVARHDGTPLLMIFYRGTNEEQFDAWATKANHQLMAERVFWEFIDEDEEAHGVTSDVDALKARYERFHTYVGLLAGLSWDDRNAIMDAYEGMLLVYLADPSK